MCDCALLVDRHHKPITIPRATHRFIYIDSAGRSTVLLEGFVMEGMLNYASVSTIEHSHGVRRGYMFVVGEALAEGEPTTTVP